MWTYSQLTGEMFDGGGTLVDTGYAGKGNAKNDPDQQCATDMGPIPRGYYTVRPAVEHPKLGPVAIPLTPDSANDMCHRSGFYIHGDSVADPGNASNGCIILRKTSRVAINASADKRLRVVRASMLSANRVRRRKGRREQVRER